MARIENHKYTVEEAFRENFYIVPDYQREYVWTDKEIHQLLDDINDEIDVGSTQEYFIGTVLVSPTEQKSHHEVIDGQQRLTTLFLLLCCMRNRFRNQAQEQTINGLISTNYTTKLGDTATSLKLEPRYENAGEVMNKIVELGSEPDKTRARIQAVGIKTYGAIENLVSAYEIINRYLEENYQDYDSLKRYWGYIANNVVFIQLSTAVSSALKIFETINERGIGLNPMDLLKNLLFRQVTPAEFTKLKDEWKKVTKPLEANKEKPLRFLRYFLMANYKIENHRRDAIVREDEIYDWFINKNNALLVDYQNKPFEFTRKIAESVNQFIAYSEGRGNDGKASIAMDNLKRLCGGGFSLHYVLLLAGSNLPKDLFDHFLRQLESFLFYYIFTKTPTKDLERNFSLWADDLRSIAHLQNAQDQKTKLNQFVHERFDANMKAKDAELEDDLRRYTLHSMQQYRTRYFLAKLTQYVDMAYKGLKTSGSLEEYAVLEMEHILPENPESTLRQCFSAQNPDINYDEYKNKLGNLTLLEKPINIVAGNDFFQKKALEYKKCKNYLTSSIAQINTVGANTSINRVNQKLEAFTDWSANNIDKRQQILIDLAKDVWTTHSIPLD
ncbi:MAG TPA: DUF262 domain-containing HNH endonuclease family protein [Pyrinomonadaceae bacterium]|nr:DUF262 domain-containing HNH endonuclease family protein [Pyrinomonadaceae bacterium]